MQTSPAEPSISQPAISTDQAYIDQVSASVPAPAEQKRIIEELIERPFTIGENYCLVPQQWWRKFSNFVGIGLSGPAPEASSPGLLDCNCLLSSDGSSIRVEFSENVDFRFVPEEAFKKLLAWFGKLR